MVKCQELATTFTYKQHDIETITVVEFVSKLQATFDQNDVVEMVTVFILPNYETN